MKLFKICPDYKLLYYSFMIYNLILSTLLYYNVVCICKLSVNFFAIKYHIRNLIISLKFN